MINFPILPGRHKCRHNNKTKTIEPMHFSWRQKPFCTPTGGDKLNISVVNKSALHCAQQRVAARKKQSVIILIWIFFHSIWIHSPNIDEVIRRWNESVHQIGRERRKKNVWQRSTISHDQFEYRMRTFTPFSLHVTKQMEINEIF